MAAFGGNASIYFKQFPVIALWTGDVYAADPVNDNTTPTMFNLSGIGPFEKIYIFVEAQSFTGTPTFDIFWAGATDVDQQFATLHHFWTAVPTSTTQAVFTYFATRNGNVLVQGGVGVESKGMFDVPYFGLGIINNGAAGEFINFTMSACAEKF